MLLYSTLHDIHPSSSPTSKVGMGVKVMGESSLLHTSPARSALSQPVTTPKKQMIWASPIF